MQERRYVGTGKRQSTVYGRYQKPNDRASEGSEDNRELAGQIVGGRAGELETVYALIYDGPKGSEIEWLRLAEESDEDPVEMKVITKNFLSVASRD